MFSYSPLEPRLLPTLFKPTNHQSPSWRSILRELCSLPLPTKGLLSVFGVSQRQKNCTNCDGGHGKLVYTLSHSMQCPPCWRSHLLTTPSTYSSSEAPKRAAS